MNAYVKKCKLMGSDFELCVVSNDANKAKNFLNDGVQEIKRIEALLTEFNEMSFTSKINQNSGEKAVHVPNDVFDLIDRSLRISRLSNGYFDITVGPLKKLYRFKNTEIKFPTKKHISNALQKVGYQNIQLNFEDKTVFLQRNNMHLSFAAIGKGFAADSVKKLWKQNKFQGGYVNASGDLTAFGTNEKKEFWKIGIANPDNQDHILFYLPLNNACVATSGDYEQHFIYKGERYSHNINPRTGYPIKGIKSVTVISPSAELSDALATAVYTMGKTKGLAFINQLPNTHVILIDEKNNVSFSENLEYETIS